MHEETNVLESTLRVFLTQVKLALNNTSSDSCYCWKDTQIYNYYLRLAVTTANLQLKAAQKIWLRKDNANHETDNPRKEYLNDLGKEKYIKNTEHSLSKEHH